MFYQATLIKEWFENGIGPIFAKFEKEFSEQKKEFIAGQVKK